jgi:ethanolamine phosphate transferase 2 subunit G
MASNYNMPRLLTGQAIALAAFIAALMVQPSMKAFKPLLPIMSAYSAMMFASSYVEEEQHFWYWVTSAWLVLVASTQVERLVFSLPIISSLQETHFL